MHSRILFPRLCALFCLCALGDGETKAHSHADPPHTDHDGPVTVSPAAGSFLGSWMRTRRGRVFQAYRGIKYAEPPVGKLRFQPPQPILRYSSPVNATEDGPACPQPPTSSNSYIDEDCLTINVYTPSNQSERSHPLPVILFMHPGGFYSGSGRTPAAGPHYLLDRDLVLVTINYRIGSLGFLALGIPEAPGNNGFRDQVEAMRWVKRNIAAFGGDPDCVTISGLSAGSVSVMVHMISPMSKGLFHRAISMSGSPTSKVPSPSSRMDLAIKQSNSVRCDTHSVCPITPLTAPEEMFQCFMNKTWTELAGTLMAFFEFGFDPLSLFRPVVEPDFGQERFLPVEPMDAIRGGKMHAVPYIISQTRDEFFWKAFCEYLDPNPRGDTPELSSLAWPAMTPADRKYLKIGKEFSVHENLFEDRFKVWDEIYPIQY